VDFCKRDDQFYRHCHGTASEQSIGFQYTIGKTNRFWTPPGINVFLLDKKGYVGKKSADAARIELPVDWTAEKLLKIEECEGHIYYCPKCDDHFPDSDSGDTICRHIYWCDKCDVMRQPNELCSCQHKRKAAGTRKKMGIIRVYRTLESVFEEGKRKYGPDQSKWKFRCPKCNRVAARPDYEKLDFGGATGRSCITARMESKSCRLMEHDDLNPICITEKGKPTETTYFAFAD